MANKIKFKINNDNFSSLIDKLDDLTKIDDTIKMKIDSEHILIYSMLASGQTILAFKSYLIDTEDYLDSINDLEYSFDVVISSAKKFVKNLTFLNLSDKITLEIAYKKSQDDDNVMIARSLQVISGKLKVNWITGENYEIRDINKNTLKQKLDLKFRKWAFSMKQSEFSDVKKLSNINNDRLININVTDGKVFLSEKAAWELEIESVELDKNASLILNKKFLPCINDSLNNIEFNIFENFMLVKDENSNLMLSFEQSFDDD